MIVKIINGAVSVGERMAAAPIEVRFTSDAKGENLSLANGNIMLFVPFEQVQKMIDKERKKRNNILI